MHIDNYSIGITVLGSMRLSTSELVSFILFSKVDIGGVAGTWEKPAAVLVSTFKNKTKPVLKLLVYMHCY